MQHVLDAHAQGEPVTEDQALELIYDRKADFEPGTSASYNNTAYVLASRIITRLLGQPYQDVLRERILEPLGLDDTYFEKHDAFEQDRLAHGYRDASELGLDFDDWYEVDQGYGFANGGIVQSVDDLTRFFRAVPGGQQALPNVDFAQLLATLRPEGEGYGLGLISDGRCYAHAGNFTGYSTRAFSCPDTQVSGALFSSSTVPEHEALVESIFASLSAAE
jgi:D-alanyl-D-alanine carboxypeptidase